MRALCEMDEKVLPCETSRHHNSQNVLVCHQLHPVRPEQRREESILLKKKTQLPLVGIRRIQSLWEATATWQQHLTEPVSERKGKGRGQWHDNYTSLNLCWWEDYRKDDCRIFNCSGYPLSATGHIYIINIDNIDNRRPGGPKMSLGVLGGSANKYSCRTSKIISAKKMNWFWFWFWFSVGAFMRW